MLRIGQISLQIRIKNKIIGLMKQPKLRLPVFLNSPTSFLDEVNFVDTYRHYLVYYEKELNAISNVSQNLIVSVNIASLRKCC